MVLEGDLYVGASLCSLCGFNIFGARAVISIDACHLFPQCVLIVMPLIKAVQIWQLVLDPGVLGVRDGSGTPPEHKMASEAGRDHSWRPRGRRWGLMITPGIQESSGCSQPEGQRQQWFATLLKSMREATAAHDCSWHLGRWLVAAAPDDY